MTVPLIKTWSLLFWVIAVRFAGAAPQVKRALGTINWRVSGTLVGKLEESLINAGYLNTGVEAATWFL